MYAIFEYAICAVVTFAAGAFVFTVCCFVLTLQLGIMKAGHVARDLIAGSIRSIARAKPFPSVLALNGMRQTLVRYLTNSGRVVKG
jgi:hypothetical protein